MKIKAKLEPPTEKQLKYIQAHASNTNRFTGSSKQEATEWITKKKNEGDEDDYYSGPYTDEDYPIFHE